MIFAVFHLVVAAWAVAMQLGKNKKAWKYVWIIPLVYALLAGIEGLMAGSFVGLLLVALSTFWALLISISLGAVYSAGNFKMSTWIPFIWSLINVFVLILSSFSIQGGL